jgi:O-antigen biosynthesis protein
VTTTLGAEGMDLHDAHDVLIRDSAEEFATATVSLYRDAALWQRLAETGRDTVLQRWSPAAMSGRLEELLADARARIGEPVAARRP